MDGLLVDSEPCWDAARKAWAAERGIFDWGPDDHRACMGVSTLTWANYMIRRLALDLPPQAVIDRVVESMREIYRRACPISRARSSRCASPPVTSASGWLPAPRRA